MRKFVLFLMCLAATPVFALTVSLVDMGGGVVAVNYNSAGDANQPRAFALDITIDGTAVITDVNGFKEGESTAASPGFGIFPGTIDINDAGVVQDYGTPLAPSGDPGAGSNLPAQHVVLEIGSLYEGERGDGNEPLTAGTLCNIVIDCNGATSDVNIVLTEEDTYRGGVVLEDISTPDPNVTASLVYGCAPTDCWDYDCFDCGDGNGDCFITFGDLSLILNAWNPLPYDRCADYNKDGFVTFGDISVLINHWPPDGVPPHNPGCTDCGPCTPLP